MAYSDGPNPFRRKPLPTVPPFSQELEDTTSSARQNDPWTAVHLLNRSEGSKESQYNTATPVKDRSIYARYFKDWWLLEILCWIIAAASIGAIIAMLCLYDGQSVSHWGAKITINTAIATCATVAKGALMVSVASCLGQLKWMWFTNRSRRLTDLQVFDNASRGAIGSITLVSKLKGGYLGLTGAVVTILALATSPAVQQLLTFTSSSIVIAGVASVPRCQNFTGGSLIPDARGFQQTAAFQLTEATYDSIFSSASTPLLPVDPFCSSGNCTWEIYQSMSVCASVADVTDQLSDMWAIVPAGGQDSDFEVSGGAFPSLVNVTGWFLPNGAGVLNSVLNLTSSGPALLSGSRTDSGQSFPPALTSLAFENVLEPISDFYIAFSVPAAATVDSVTAQLPLAYMAFECILQFCVQSFNTTTVNGVSTTIITSSFINDTYGSTQFAILGNDPSDYIYNSNKSMLDGNIYAANVEALLGLQEYFSNAFTGSYGSAVGPSNYNSDGPTVTDNFTSIIWTANASATESNIAGGIYNSIKVSSNITDRLTYLNNTQTLMNNLATSLTNSIRQGANLSEYAHGRVYKDEIIIEVRWLWMIFPFALLTLGLLLLIGTMVASSQTKSLLWKSSVMALLLSLSDDERRGLVGLDRTSVMDTRAETVNVSLEREGEEWKLLRR